MKLAIILDDGTVQTAVEDLDGYNLLHPFARDSVVNQIIDAGIATGVDLTVAREAPRQVLGVGLPDD